MRPPSRARQPQLKRRIRLAKLSQLCALAIVFHLAAPLAADERSTGKKHLTDEISAILARKEFATSSFGIVVARLRSGQILYAHNPDKLFAPASTAKLVSCAGALAALGGDHRLVTRVVSDAAPEAGTLHGDLTLVAAGDPNLSQRVQPEASHALPESLAFTDRDHSYCGLSDGSVVPGDPLAVLATLVAQLRTAGIERIQGDVLVDDGLFRENEDSFVGEFSAACINDNLVDVFVAPGGAVDEPVRVRWQPDSSTVRIDSQANTNAAGGPNLLWLEPGDGPAAFKLRGSIALDSAEVLRTAQIRQPALVAARYLKETLEKGGVVVEGTAATRRQGPAHYEDFATLASHTSAPLGAALRVILKTSQNLHATMLPVLIGALRGERGDRYAGFKVIARHLKEMGVEPSQAVFTSGSGGGREDHTSARWLVGLLRALAQRDDFPTLLDALPVGGVDGTLAPHFCAPDLVGRVRAKTGTLLFRSALDSTWVYVSKALAGYIEPRDLEPSDSWRSGRDDKLVFAILIHGTRARKRSEATTALFAAQENIIRAVLRHTPND